MQPLNSHFWQNSKGNKIVKYSPGAFQDLGMEKLDLYSKSLQTFLGLSQTVETQKDPQSAEDAVFGTTS